MKNETTVTVDLDGKTLTIGSGLLARQAAGSATVQLGDTVLLSAVTCTDKPRDGIDYFPLQVEYREKYSAAGRFPGGYFKREARPSEKEILTARFTDRPIRSLFPSTYRNDVQINNMLLSADRQNDSDVLSIVAASTALTLSEIPFMGPIGGLRVGRVEGKFVVNPTHEQIAKSDLDLVYAGTEDLPVMIEGSAREVSEGDIVAAMRFAHGHCVRIVQAQKELRAKLGLAPKVVREAEEDATFVDAARAICGPQLAEALLVPGKLQREGLVTDIKRTLKQKLQEQHPQVTEEQVRSAFDRLEIEIVRRNVLEKGRRIDGRRFDELRPLTAMVGVLPRTHGSAVFSRGETQALGTITLGTGGDAQELDAITGGADEKQFMVHYNFPPYSTGEVGRLGSTGRREIGHGALAERSLREVLPPDYPYTIRMVSDIMGSNGSSSMASVCVGSLALMDAGIPVRGAVAGISIGLFTAPGRAELVTDIIGAEDHCGDMDFKVAGTRVGVTGFQVDLKIRGLPWEVVERAFGQAHKARLQILDFMDTAIAAPRAELSPHAPRIRQIKIPVDKIGGLIGPGGKNIRRITELSGAEIQVDPDGTVNIYAVDGDAMDIAVREVEMIGAEVEEGKTYLGTVTGIKDFGAFVEVLPGKDGLVHISELADFRVRSVEDVCKLGDEMWVKCIGVDDRGRVKLSRKQAMRERDETPAAE